VEIWKRFGEKEVSHSMAHYLQTVAAISSEKGHARVGEIAEQLGVSKSGVTSMLHQLERHGLVRHERYGGVQLTDAGAGFAARTESSRRVLTMFLSDILGVPADIAAEDACMIEHLVSAEVSVELLRLTTFLRSGHPAARQFIAAYRVSPQSCADMSPDACNVCADDTCLHETLVSHIERAAPRS
jgi:DtxR family Mn-dependent transcriptional regulator